MATYYGGTRRMLPLPAVTGPLLVIGSGLFVLAVILPWPPRLLWWAMVVGLACIGLSIMSWIPTLIREERMNRKI